MPELKRIDVGSGGFKKPGHIGIDVLPVGAAPNHDIDIVCDIERARWPLDDGSVSHIFSSHCFEHVDSANLPHIFREMTRVACDGAQVEIWNPYAFHRDAHVQGHITYLTEELYYHVCCGHQAQWAAGLGARWFLREVRYHVDPRVLASLEEVGIGADMAINHFLNIVKEFGVFIVIDKSDNSSLLAHDFRRTLVDDVPSVEIRSSRESNPRLLSIGPYVPQRREGRTPRGWREGVLTLLGRPGLRRLLDPARRAIPRGWRDAVVAFLRSG